eukprot:8570840-Lingulodinium_polyedra.AAC.1
MVQHAKNIARAFKQQSTDMRHRVPLKCAFRNLRTPCAHDRVVVDAWSAQIAKCTASQRPNAYLNAFVRSFRSK